MKHLFIINPQAGKGKTKDYIPRIKELCKSEKLDYIIEVTKCSGDATILVKEYVEKEDLRVYSVGGDGTLNEVLNGMVGSNSSLAIIPSGSGNDFIKSIGTMNSWEEILEKSIYGQTIPVDIGKFNDRYFINISSAGLDAEIAYNARRLKKNPIIPSKFAYLFSIFLTVFGYKSKKLRIIMDDVEINRDTLLVAIANGRFYGGGMMVAPEAKVSDGIFDICQIDRVSVPKIIRLFPRLIKGKHKTIKEVNFYNAKKVKIISDEEINFNIDGELIRMKEALIEVVPKAIMVVSNN